MTSSLFPAIRAAENGLEFAPAGWIFTVDGTVYPGAPAPPVPAFDNGVGGWAGFASGMVAGLANAQDGLWASACIGYPASVIPMGPSVTAGVVSLATSVEYATQLYYSQHGTFEGLALIFSGYSQGAMVVASYWTNYILNPLGAHSHLAPYVYRLYQYGDPYRCFPAGTLVRMSDGTERCIEDVEVGDFVVTAEGGVGRVTQTSSREETNRLATLKIEGHRHLRCTTDHPILTKRGYVRADQLTTSDWVAFPKYLPESKTYVSTHEHIYRYGKVREDVSLNIPDKIELDEDFGRLIGLYLAEGSCIRGNKGTRINLDFNVDERDTLVADVVRILARYGATAQVYWHESRPNSLKVSLCSEKWGRLLSSLCGVGCNQKQLHVDLAGGPRAFLSAVLYGWLDGDGHLRRKSWCGTTVSRLLAMNMYDIAQALDLKPTLITRHRPGQQREWQVTLTSPQTPKTLDEYERIWGRGSVPGVSFHKSYRGSKKWRASIQHIGHKVELGHFATQEEAASVVRRYRVENGLLDDQRGRTRHHLDDHHVWRRLKSVDFTPFVGTVYDITVPGDDSFVAEGVGVHNCPGIAHGNALAGLSESITTDGVETGGIGGKLDLPPAISNILAPDGRYVYNSCANKGDIYAACPTGLDPWNNIAGAGKAGNLIFTEVQNLSLVNTLKIATALGSPIGVIEELINGMVFMAQGTNAAHWQYYPQMDACIQDALELGNSLPHKGC